jgi:predicted GIY-YIG superfamily endonuclease
MNTKDKQYIYIAQTPMDDTRCKIGITDNLERRLKEYNSTTGVSKSNAYQYLFTCEVKDMKRVEDDINKEYSHMREVKNREIYFCNSAWFAVYVNFVKKHKLFKKEIFIKTTDKK